MRMHVYKMTTLRLSPEQKETVRKAAEILEKSLGRRLSQGEAVAALAEFALQNRADLANAFASETMDLAEDPFYDTSLVFDAGPRTGGAWTASFTDGGRCRSTPSQTRASSWHGSTCATGTTVPPSNSSRRKRERVRTPSVWSSATTSSTRL